MLAQIQSSIGHSDYVKRDQALKGLIQPLAGEYGMHNGQAQGQQPYDPTCDPLTPLAVLQLHSRTHLLALTLHTPHDPICSSIYTVYAYLSM